MSDRELADVPGQAADPRPGASAAAGREAAALVARARSALESGEHARAAHAAGQALGLLDGAGADDGEMVEVALVLARALDGLGRYSDAAEILDDAAAMAAELAADEPTQRLRHRLVIERAGNARARGHYRAAEALLRTALAEAQASPAADDPQLELLRATLGLVCRYLGRFDEAQVLYTQALAAAIARADLRSQATHEHNLGGLAQACGDLDAAQVHARRAVALRTRAVGIDHVETLADQAALGAILDQAGQRDEAEALLHAAIDGFEARYGRRHLEVAINLTNLAALHQRRGELDAAIASYREGLAIRESLQGAQHPELAIPLINLARALTDRGDRTQEPEALLRRAITVLAPEAVADHPTLLAARARLAALAT